MTTIDPREGRSAFGENTAAYARARPRYPARVFEILRESCGLKAGTATFEIGPGPGLATREMLRLGAAPLVAIEPDARLARFLASGLGPAHPQLVVKNATFEEVELAEGQFELGVAATSFHWLEQAASLEKVARLLKPEGWWAMWWHVFGGPSLKDPFQRATKHLMAPLERSPDSWSKDRLRFSLDTKARIADLEATDAFDQIAYETIRWSVQHDSASLAALYATFSPVTRLAQAEQQDLLRDLARIVDEEFGGRVERPFVMPIYIARRR